MIRTTKRDFLLSIRPLYAEKIVRGQKTVELRRRFSSGATGATILIYSTSPTCAIVGSARVSGVLRLKLDGLWEQHGAAACIDRKAFDAYFDGLDSGYAIILRDARPFDTQVAAADLRERFGFVAPQSFMYLRREHYPLLNYERI
ncbi:MAG: ASCH domain-containing protein [Roseiarcus sp.]